MTYITDLILLLALSMLTISYLIQFIGYLFLVFSILVIFLFTLYYFKVKRHVYKHKPKINKNSPRPPRIAFFHPYCNGGGGGERVLWQAVHAIQIQYPDIECAVYTCDDIDRKTLLDNVSRSFYIDLQTNIELVYLNGIKYIQPQTYPILTILGQNIGSLFLAHEALGKYQPDIYIDTVGFAFTLPYFKLFGQAMTGCYVHYPTVSTDMLSKVKSQSDTFNNSPSIRKSSLLTFLKLGYYKIFAWFYGLAGARSELTLVNSSWTKGHIDTIWGKRAGAQIIYPPCDTSAFAGLELTRRHPKNKFVVSSIGQFRPEKNHQAQLKAFEALLTSIPEESRSYCDLFLVGSCRDEQDLLRVQALRRMSITLGIADQVSFHTNIPFHELLACLSQTDVGIHTMENEHFGISLVEMMAAGCVMLAHNSGGPRMDIVCERGGGATGFLAEDEKDFGQKLKEIYSLTPEERMVVSENARQYVVDKFSIDTFEREFMIRMENLFKKFEAACLK